LGHGCHGRRDYTGCNSENNMDLRIFSPIIVAILSVHLPEHVIDHQNPYFSERSPESEGDKIIIRAPGHPERSLLRARVTDHGLPADHAAAVKLRCLPPLRAVFCAISPANRSTGNDRFSANVQKTTFSRDRQHRTGLADAAQNAVRPAIEKGKP